MIIYNCKVPLLLMSHFIIFWSKVEKMKMNSKIILGGFFVNVVVGLLKMLQPLSTTTLQDSISLDMPPRTTVRKESPLIELEILFLTKNVK